MTFKSLCAYFDQLEQTSSRLILIDILVELFREVSTEEVPLVCYLLQGRIAPFYEPIELGMAEKNVAAAIAKSFDVTREQVLEEYSKTGDLGVVASELSSNTEHKTTPITISEIFAKLTKIAHYSGEGTVEHKVGDLSSLLSSLTPIEAKHLVRIPLGISRLGVGDPTILDAFALLKLGDKSKRRVLESAYNKVSDLGLVGTTLWQKGLSGVEKMDVVVGRPIRSQLAERLPNPDSILKKFDGEAHVQFKYDGFRVQIHKDGQSVRLFSRNLEETTLSMPDIVEGVLAQIKAKTVILDSEALAYNPLSEEFLPFQETTKRRRKHGVEEAAKSLPLKAFVFDIMYLEGESLMDEPLTERVKLLDKVINGNDVLISQPGEITDDATLIQSRFDQALTEGLEGLIVKRPDSKYEAGARNFNWVKQKRNSSGELSDTIDCVILGYLTGRGKRAEFGAGALLVGVYDHDKDAFVTVAKIGTGLTDDEWRDIFKKCDKLKLSHKPARVESLIEPSVWVEPKIVVEILADEITRSPIHTAGKVDSDPGYALRFPRLIRFREEDKSAEDATTVEELVKLFNQQFKKD